MGGWLKEIPKEKLVLNREEHSPETWERYCLLFGGSYETTTVITVNIKWVEIYDK